MKYLLDTNVFVFIVDNEFDELSTIQRQIINDENNEFVISEASIYELAIKSRKNLFSFKQFSFDDAFSKARQELKIGLIKAKASHYSNIREVEQILKSNKKPHADPFDLLIISQAMIEHLPILSTDEYFPQYKSIKVIQKKVNK